jgi:hypothetical protein
MGTLPTSPGRVQGITHLGVFLPNTTSADAGILQRIAVTIPLVTMAAVAARLAALDHPERPRQTPAQAPQLHG